VSSVYVTLAIVRSMTVEAGSRRIRRMFATYVPPEVVDEMTQNQGSFKLGGERRDLSILFSDVRDFTSLSERLGAENVVQLMNTYLTAMTRIVFDSRGTLDKYIGDAIISFWGAPLPLDDHPLRACEAALLMQEEIARLRREQPDLPGVESLRVGIGIHTAEVVVGNFGSEQRFDYTVTGDGVNLCSRLEGLTKVYGAAVLSSSDLIARLPPGFLSRELDVIRVKGKTEAVRIFEVLGRREADAVESAAFDAYATGFDAYREGKWDAAERALRESQALLSHKACLLLLDRIEGFRRESPQDWEGIWSFETK
jgi:adenylate cyclase